MFLEKSPSFGHFTLELNILVSLLWDPIVLMQLQMVLLPKTSKTNKKIVMQKNLKEGLYSRCLQCNFLKLNCKLLSKTFVTGRSVFYWVFYCSVARFFRDEEGMVSLYGMQNSPQKCQIISLVDLCYWRCWSESSHDTTSQCSDLV